MKKRIISNADFVHLHLHTEYSSFDGLNRVNKFPLYARKQGFKALACTDHGNISGCIKFMQECVKSAKDENGEEIPKIKPIIGFEAYLSKDRKIHSVEGQPDKRKGNRHLLLLAKNWEGYQNICRLSQASWTEGFYIDPRIDFELLAKHSKGVIASSACLSSIVNNNLLHGRYEQAKKSVSLLKDIFKDDFYLEAMYHGIDAEGMIIPDIIKLGKEMNVKVICSNDVHMCEKCQGPSHELLMAMSTSKCLTDPKHLHFPYHEFYLKSALEMSQIFGSHPEMMLNTNLIAEKVDSDDIVNHLTSGMRLPRFKIPDNFKTPHEYLEHLAWQGMKKLNWDKSQPHIDRLNLELSDIKVAWDNNRYDFATYFLIVQDYMQEARRRNILTGAGRGSGFASVLLRCLGISYGPDPLEYGLLWERFLGFDDKYFIQESDFGLDEVQTIEEKIAIVADSENEEDDLFVERDVSNDLGGVDRY